MLLCSSRVVGKHLDFFWEVPHVEHGRFSVSAPLVDLAYLSSARLSFCWLRDIARLSIGWGRGAGSFLEGSLPTLCQPFRASLSARHGVGHDAAANTAGPGEKFSTYVNISPLST